MPDGGVACDDDDEEEEACGEGSSVGLSVGDTWVHESYYMPEITKVLS